MEVAELLVMLAFTLPISFLPGPNNLLSASHCSRYGFDKSLPLISGMVLGWFILGIIVAYGALFIEENKDLLKGLTYVGVTYIVYLSYQISTASIVNTDNLSEEKLGIKTGIMLQLVNGKAFIHLLILMTSFGTVFGNNFLSKMIVVALNVGIKLVGWCAWGIFGSKLREKFYDARSGVLINKIFGISLFCVAIWILIG